MERETYCILSVIYFSYLIAIITSIILVPDQIDKNGGYIALGLLLGVTIIVILCDYCCGIRRNSQNNQYTSVV